MAADFITVTITGLQHQNPQTGDFDPSIPTLLSDLLYQKGLATLATNRDTYTTRIRALADANLYAIKAASMKGGDPMPWWDKTTLPTDEMTYECDSNLGSPATRDCAHVEWDQLGASTDTMTLVSGEVKFLSSSMYKRSSSLEGNLLFDILAKIPAMLPFLQT